ncbi:smoothelin-like protein 1 isoform X2 [Protopterus annectens]|uniref:smoothelin-like protein 1 isoform X2 n=1 Tax=Protopterus annectens TaxID=7888 RepID=UPI001CFA5BB1|nr:smoothelin-like protein 1 isoform X2 [Protopterus annectens]
METTGCSEVHAAVEESKKSGEVTHPEKEEKIIGNMEDSFNSTTEYTADEKEAPEMDGIKDSEQKAESLKSDVSSCDESHGFLAEPVLPVVKDSSGNEMMEEKRAAEDSQPAPAIQSPEAPSEIPSEEQMKDIVSSEAASVDKVESGMAASSLEADISEKKTEAITSAATFTAEGSSSVATTRAEDSSSVATSTVNDISSEATSTAEVTSEPQIASKVSEGTEADTPAPATQTDAVTSKSKVSSTPGDAPSAIRRTASDRSRRTVSEGDASREPAETTAAASKRLPEKKREIGRSQTIPKSYGPQSRRSIVAKFEKESGGSAGAAAPRLKVSRATSLTNPSNVKQMLLDWCRAKTRDYEHVEIQNFSSSWSDGMAFCALVHKHFPDAFDYSELNPNNRRANFELAFTMAEKYADCVPLLEVDDMVATKVPDWKCIYLYIQEFYRSLVQKGLVKTKK